MKRNTLILRLVVLAGALVVLAVLVIGLLTAQPGQEATRQARLLSDQALLEQLAEEGHAVERLRREGGLVEARLEDGRTLWLDATTGELLEVPEKRGSALQGGRLREILREGGYREIGAISWRRGAFETEASDAEGQRWRLRLDTYSGEVLEREAAGGSG